MYRFAANLIIISAFLLGMPLAGVWLAGHDLVTYLVFPHITSPMQHEPFSWIAWFAMAGFILVVLAFFVYAISFASVKQSQISNQRLYRLPWWGKSGVILVIVFWILAWNRFAWFTDLQVYTFTPIWLGYILIINALTSCRKGYCLLTREPLYLLSLFLLSAIFWWYYEYLNIFIRNWHYVGTEKLSTVEIIIHSSFAYATVLPAVLSTAEWLNTFPRLDLPSQQRWELQVSHPQLWAIASWLGGSITLGLATLWPEILFPLVWIAPLFVIAGLKYLLEGKTIFSVLVRGNWQPVLLPALAALCCGFFWELWNVKSFAHWEYSVPYVQAFHLFEMPLLGYAGYLPFGLTCLAIADLLPGSPRMLIRAKRDYPGMETL